MTNEERGIKAIIKAKLKHPNLYGYDLIDIKTYGGAQVKVPILCIKCNEIFYQNMGHHIFGQGCPTCGRLTSELNRRKTNEEFIIDARVVHGDLYEYTRTKYTVDSAIIIITCKTHGDFEQVANNHLAGNGCHKCAMISRKKYLTKSNDDFIIDANVVHDNFYIYPRTNYILDNIEVIITCPAHGDFEQLPNSHLAGRGCPKCGEIRRIEKKTKTHLEFITDARDVHGEMFDYSLDKYKGTNIKFTIKCNCCSFIFKQLPTNHLQGAGCPRCADKLTLTNELFIEKATKIHGDMFEYSLVSIIGNKSKVEIKCNTCGDLFLQSPNSHLKGRGCPACKSSKNERAIAVYLKKNNISYISQKMYEGLVGVGRRRLKFDFYIPAKDLLIEFDGGQHFGKLTIGKYTLTHAEYEKLKEHDRRKNEYTKNNNIKLLRIPYWEAKNIKVILDKEFGIVR